ncbi:MAG TPA: phosphotransferase family protein [Pseudomonadales bacterium]|nr:phosphotransferase family protein [Pseudomonadales bacterium]
MTEVREVAEVRAGEEQDWPALEAWLRANVDADVDLSAPMQPLQFPSGSANLTYLMRFGDTELVVRRPPFGTLAPGAHDMAREHRVLSRLWRIFPQAPRAYAFCDDEAVIGAPFFVMERREGVVIFDEIPGAMRHHDDVARRVSFALVDAMADFHALDPAAADLGDLGRPDGFVARQVSGWHKRWELAKLDALPAMDAVHARLERHLPTAARASFVHNDLKLDNCQFDPADPDRVKSIFDWDMTTLGDPLVDLGTLLGYWPDPSDTVIRASREGWSTMGLPSRAEITAHYARRAGIDAGSVDWYEAFALWKTAVVIQQIYVRYVRGQTQDPRFADRGAKVPVLAGLAADVLDRAGLD